MKKPVILIACLLLAGCTDADWNRALNYGGMAEAEPDVEPVVMARTSAPQPLTVTPAASAGSDFCKGVATQDATANSFDPATQQRVLRQSYDQCLTIYAR